MAKLKSAVAILAAAVTVGGFSLPASANRPCGFDRYGYHPPDFGCFRHLDGWGYYPIYGRYPAGPPPFRPAYGYYARPPYGMFPAPGTQCHYDNGWYGVRLVCY